MLRYQLPLSLRMIRQLSRALNLPADILVQETPSETSTRPYQIGLKHLRGKTTLRACYKLLPKFIQGQLRCVW